MIKKKQINIMTFVIIILSLFACVVGICSNFGSGSYDFVSIHNETVEIYGKGIYRFDSVSCATQAIAQDYVTLFLGIPLLLISLFLFNKGLLKGKILLTGTVAYFLYTYTSYAFLSMYNSLFLIYVILFSTCFFTFTLLMISFDVEKMSLYFNDKLAKKFIGSVLIFMAFILMMLWLGRIVPPLINGTYPVGLEHYTTLVIQVLDLGLIVPLGLLSGILLIKNRPFGYLLAPVFIIKSITMLSAISAMIFRLINAGENISIVEVLIFPMFNIVVIFCLFNLLSNIKENVIVN